MVDKKQHLPNLPLIRLKIPVLIIAMTLLVHYISMQYLAIELPNKLQDFFTLSLSIFVEAFPFLVLGSVLAAVVNTYISHETFHKILPKNYALKRFVMSFLGFLFPVCECGNVPLSRSLLMRGLRPSEAVTFLLSAPVINPVTIWATWTAFSYDESIVASRVVATLLIANIIGYIISLKKNQKEFLTDSFIALCDSNASEPEKPAKKNLFKISKLSDSFSHEAFTMIKMLAFGALVAGTIQTFVPRDVLVGIGSNVILSIVAMLLLAFVISICANVDAFFALSFANTFTAGSIVSFLVFGPMIDIKMITLLKTTFKNNFLFIVSTLVLLFSFITGLLVTYAF